MKRRATRKPAVARTNSHRKPVAAPMRNVDIASRFENTADALAIEGANPFRIRAYRNAARMLRAHGTEMSDLVAAGTTVSDLPGIGEDLAARIIELVTTGQSTALDQITRTTPPFELALLALPGIGPRRARQLYEKEGIRTRRQLERAALDHRLRDIAGIGARGEESVLAALRRQEASGQRTKLAAAGPQAQDIVAHLERQPGISNVTIAGSLRRGCETVGDIDILATATDGPNAIAHFLAYPGNAATLSSGRTRASVRLASGIQADFRVVPEESYGAALHYLTGSKSHNIALRRIAQARGLKLSEYGIFRGRQRIAGDTEENVYRTLGLPFIPPELREDQGEIPAARRLALPHLVTLADLRGDLHTHSTASDGKASIAAMANAARAAGLDYIAVTDHSRRLAVAHGLDRRRLHAQLETIDRLNASGAGATILKGIEAEILDDGRLDMDDGILAELDLVIAAVHSGFNLSRERQTDRILRAMENPLVSILAHPTGRLLQQREPYDADMARIITEAAANRCILELNAHPDRLDLTATWCHEARDAGVLISVASDAHQPEDFANLGYGITQARRGWLSATDIVNTRPLGELRRILRQRL